MAKKGKTPKDSVALKGETGPTSTPKSSSSTPKVDGSAVSTSSGGRKVRINEDSPLPAVKKQGSNGMPAGKKRAAAASVALKDGEEDANAVIDTDAAKEQKFSPKHKEASKQPEKSALKSSKKRKAEEELDSEADTTAADVSTMTLDESTAGEEAEDGEEIDFLAGFESADDEDEEEDGADSSDEEGAEPISLKQLPEAAAAKEKAVASTKGKKQKKNTPGVIYLGRIPHGFHENEMRQYFSQFGDVTRLRLSRNRETGASKHYAFIEFEHESVATIVAETMDNYLLSGHILQCKIVPADQVHPKLWIGANRKFRPVPKGRIERLRHNAPKSEAQKSSITTRLLKREQAKRDKLKELGIVYDFEGYVKTLPEKQEKDQKEEEKARKTAKKLEDQVKKDADGKKLAGSSPANGREKRAKKTK